MEGRIRRAVSAECSADFFGGAFGCGRAEHCVVVAEAFGFDARRIHGDGVVAQNAVFQFCGAFRVPPLRTYRPDDPRALSPPRQGVPLQNLQRLRAPPASEPSAPTR